MAEAVIGPAEGAVEEATPARDTSALTAGQRLALKYFTVAMVLFVAQMLFGLLAGLQFLFPELLYGVLDFNVNRMVHINAMIVWMLYGFIGSIYWRWRTRRASNWSGRSSPTSTSGC